MVVGRVEIKVNIDTICYSFKDLEYGEAFILADVGEMGKCFFPKNIDNLYCKLDSESARIIGYGGTIKLMAFNQGVYVCNLSPIFHNI